MSAKTIAFAPRRKGGDAPLVINADTIRYIQMKRNYAEVHLTNGAVFTSRITMEELEQHLGDDFIKVHRSCLVAVRAIHNVEDTVVLNSGEQLEYVVRQKKRILEQLQTQQKRLILTMQDDTAPANAEEYHEHYVVRFRFHPCGGSGRAPGAELACRSVYGRRGSVPRLVPVQPADQRCHPRRCTLPCGAEPWLGRGRRGQADA